MHTLILMAALGKRPCLAPMKIAMYFMNYHELAARLKNIFEKKRIYIIFCSQHCVRMMADNALVPNRQKKNRLTV